MPYPPLRHRRGRKWVIKAIRFLYCHTSYVEIIKDEQPCLPGTSRSPIQTPAYINLVLNVYILEDRLAVWTSIAELKLIQRYMKVVMHVGSFVQIHWRVLSKNAQIVLSAVFSIHNPTLLISALPLWGLCLYIPIYVISQPPKLAQLTPLWLLRQHEKRSMKQKTCINRTSNVRIT